MSDMMRIGGFKGTVSTPSDKLNLKKTGEKSILPQSWKSGESFSSSGETSDIAMQKPRFNPLRKVSEETCKAWKEICKTCAYLDAVVSGTLSNMPFPTVIDPFPEDEKEKVLSLLQPGDIILQKDDQTAIMQSVNKLVTGGDYVHAAIYKGEGKMIESVVKGVREADVDIYLQGYNSVQIVRPDYKSPEDVRSAIKFAEEQIGKPYNVLFKKTDKSYYCTQLVRDSLEAMPNPISVAPSETNNRLAKGIVGANAFQNMEEGEIIYSHGYDYKETMKAIENGIKSGWIFATSFTIPATLSTILNSPAVKSIGIF